MVIEEIICNDFVVDDIRFAVRNLLYLIEIDLL